MACKPHRIDSRNHAKSRTLARAQTQKSILKLVDEDYAENVMPYLLTDQGPSHELNNRFFDITQHIITGLAWEQARC